MKKLFILLFILPWFNLSHAQSAWDGLYFSQNYYGGTARFTAMGGAFTALGGDFSSLSINPAGIGVSRGYELMITPAVNYNVTDANYWNSPSKDTYTRFGLDNLGFSFSVFDDGDALKLNMGIGYNNVNQMVSRMSASRTVTDYSYASTLADETNIDYNTLSQDDAFDLVGPSNWAKVLGWNTFVIDTLPGANQYIGITDNLYEDDSFSIGGPLKQSYYREIAGNVGEYLVSFGGNIYDQFYFGINIGFQNIWRNEYLAYTEAAVNPANFQKGFKSLTHCTDITTRGSGYNIKLGVIWRPIAGLRWGAYFHSPTWMYLTDEWFESMSSNSEMYGYQPPMESSIGESHYRVNTPVKWGTGLAYVIGSSAIISVEYEGLDYSATKMFEQSGSRYVKMEYVGDESGYHYEDDYARQKFGLVTNLRAGAEYRIDALSFRLGYAYYGSPVKNDKSVARNIFSTGLGYRAGSFYVDAAYAFSPNNDNMYTMSDDMGTNSFIGKISLTLGFRF